MEDLELDELVGVGLGLGVAWREPAGLKPRPRKGLTRPVGELLRELTAL